MKTVKTKKQVKKENKQAKKPTPNVAKTGQTVQHKRTRTATQKPKRKVKAITIYY